LLRESNEVVLQFSKWQRECVTLLWRRDLRRSPMSRKQQTAANFHPAHGAGIAGHYDPWEEAYLRFESPEEEIRKFVGRLNKLGAAQWPRDSRIAELFSGRGNGLRALERLGFSNIEGVDLSPRLAAEYQGPARCYVGDCRELPFSAQSKDVLIVQGGLHHLEKLPEDLEHVFAEMSRVLCPGGVVVFVEPWLTPFLKLVHWVSEMSLARALSSKLDALATMIEHERPTYEYWLDQSDLIRRTAEKYFVPVHESISFGKWNFVGRAR
jgi:SAM-dependent methyltransferase